MKHTRVYVAGFLLSAAAIALILGLHLIESPTHLLAMSWKRNVQNPFTSLALNTNPPAEYNMMPIQRGTEELNRSSTACQCRPKSEITLDKSANRRRSLELQDWKRLHASSDEPLVQCTAFSPFQYISSGINVQPLGHTKLYGLSLNTAASEILSNSSDVSQIQLHCRNSQGVLYVTKTDYLRTFSGNNTAELTLNVVADVDKMNAILSEIGYRSTIYNIESREIIDVAWMSHLASIHVHIKRPQRPWLYDPGESGNINSKVTVITKIFERYSAVKRLISSVHKFYPGITILIADDSEFPEKIQLPNVKHYIMPFADGWFAGRNLLVSQVRTKYFLWVDDDFVFTNGTRLERFVEKFEHPNVTVDHIGGTFGDEFGRVSGKSKCLGCRVLEFQYGDEEGDCLAIRVERKYHQVSEFPQCFWADGTTNFFMARTNSVRKIGFDPFFERSGHSGYIIDTLGKLRIMGCTDVNIVHKSGRSNHKYNKFRKINRRADKYKLEHISFKNNLKCI
ncbi:beta-1,4 N-acetylgalactosaminyltransferase 1-like [Ptychodera flava]|uniref:beta-1,4 N-acetylgalactosaminyltransferase 1-like n=1 Tax=Ptychodera flava TaxID=63121 RepID=UPI003969EF00